MAWLNAEAGKISKTPAVARGRNVGCESGPLDTILALIPSFRQAGRVYCYVQVSIEGGRGGYIMAEKRFSSVYNGPRATRGRDPLCGNKILFFWSEERPLAALQDEHVAVPVTTRSRKRPQH